VKLDAFTFDFKETEWGWFNLHAYRFDAEWSTFIVETPEKNWLKAGIDKMEPKQAIALCERLFAERLDGHPPDFKCPPSSRRGGVAEVPTRAVRKVVPRKYRSDRRCRPHGAFRNRIGNQARDGGRDRTVARSLAS